MTNEDLDALEALANAASRPPWFVSKRDPDKVLHGDPNDASDAYDVANTFDSGEEGDAPFIAAASRLGPHADTDTADVAALQEALAGAEKRADEWRDLYRDARKGEQEYLAEIGRERADHAKTRAALDDSEAQREYLVEALKESRNINRELRTNLADLAYALASARATAIAEAVGVLDQYRRDYAESAGDACDIDAATYREIAEVFGRALDEVRALAPTPPIDARAAGYAEAVADAIARCRQLAAEIRDESCARGISYTESIDLQSQASGVDACVRALRNLAPTPQPASEVEALRAVAEAGRELARWARRVDGYDEFQAARIAFDDALDALDAAKGGT